MQLTVTNETDITELITKDDPDVKATLLAVLIPQAKGQRAQVGFVHDDIEGTANWLAKIAYHSANLDVTYNVVKPMEEAQQLIQRLRKLRHYQFAQTFKLSDGLAATEDTVALPRD